MAHEAFQPLNLLDRLPESIESIETWDHFLLAGASSGALIVFDVSQNIRLSKTHQKWSSKPITQLYADVRHGLLISICDGMVTLHRLGEVDKKVQSLKNTKGCTCFSVDESKSQLVLCVGLKKKVLIYSLENHTLVEKRDLSIPDVPKSLTWCGSTYLCVALRKEYVRLDVTRNQFTELAQNKSGLPSVTLLPKDQVLIGKDNSSLFQGFDGKPQRLYKITWNEAPIEVGYSFPFVIAILAKDRGIEVRSIYEKSTSFVQNIPLKGIKLICIQETDSLEAMTEGKSGSEIYLASQHQIWKLMPVPYFTQMDQLMEGNDYEEAQLMCENIAADKYKKENKLRDIRERKAYHLFCEKGQYQEALQLFLALEIPAVTVLSLYPNFLPRNINPPPPPVHVPELVGPSRDRALQALIPYLFRVREVLIEEKKFSSGKDGEESQEEEFIDITDVLQIVDTSLLRSYLLVSMESAILKLLSGPNSCHLKECETTLLNHKQYKLIVALYRSKGLHRRALDLLKRLGKNSLSEAEATIEYLLDLGSEHLEIIITYSTWVIKNYPDEALRIFTNDTDPLPPLIMLNHIKSTKQPNLATQYLEWAIKMYEKRNKREKGGKRAVALIESSVDPVEVELHNELIFQYLDVLKQLKNLEESGEHFQYDAGLLGVTRQKLLIFLDTSILYNPEKMFSRFPMDDLYEERAILYSKIGKHDEALSIYAYQLNDFTMAQRYCKNRYDPEDEHSKDVYLSLLRVYLSPPRDREVMLGPALELLKKYSGRIDTTKALCYLPPDVPLFELQDYLMSVLRETASKRRNGQVVHHLTKSEHLQLREQLISAQSAVVRVTADRVCEVCHKRLGTTVIARYPNDVVVHLKCQKDKHVCPRTQIRFDQPSASGQAI